MHLLLSSMSVVYVLTTPISEDGENATMEQIRKRNKWENDDYVCRGLILNGMSDPLFDIYQNVKSFKELWDSLEAKYRAEDASSKKFLVSNFTNYKMTNSRSVMEQYNKLLGILGRFTQHKMNMDEAIQKEELKLVELGSHLRIEESPGVQDNDKPKGNNDVGPSVVNMVEHNNSTMYNENKGKHKHHDNTKADPNKKAKPTCWKCGKIGHIKRDCKGVKVGSKTNGSGTSGSGNGSVPLKGQNMFSKSIQVYYVTYVSEAYFVQDDNVAWWVDSGATFHVCKDKCWFKTYESLNDGSILHMENESTALVHGRGCVDLRFCSGKIISLLGHVHFKRMQDMSKDELILAFDIDTEKYGRYNRKVDFQTCTCQCRKWQLSGIPCGHVIAITRFLGLIDCVQFVADWFKNPKYQGTTAESIHFLRNMQEWEFPHHIQKAIPPRMDNPQPGRPKNTNRIQSQGEEPRVIHCSRCKQAGHRRDNCNKPFVAEPPVNTRRQHDQEIPRNEQRSFYNPHQQYANTFQSYNQYSSQPYGQTTYPSQLYDQHHTNTSQPYDGNHTQSAQMYEQYDSQQHASQHLDDLNNNGSNILNINVQPMDFEDMVSYLTRKIPRRFTTLYYTLPPNNTLSCMKQIKNDYDINAMYDIEQVAGKLQLFVSHHQIDLSTVMFPNDGSLEESFAAKYIFPNASLAEMINHVITNYTSESKSDKIEVTKNDYKFDQVVEWAEQEHFEDEETKEVQRQHLKNEAHDEEACLEEQILSLMHRFADRFTDRKPEINRLNSLPDHPLIEYGSYALGCMTGAGQKKGLHT
ncbi:zinc finger, CCHC-type containing protein [Tanacetum coccineum]